MRHSTLPPDTDRSSAAVRTAIALLEMRRLARAQFPTMVSDPAWELLLALYAAGEDSSWNRLRTVGDHLALSTATLQRWLNALDQSGWVTQSLGSPDDPGDARIKLSPDGHQRMHDLLVRMGQLDPG